MPSFSVPTPGDLTAQESLPPGNLPSKAKKMLMPGGQPGGVLGAGGIDWCIKKKFRGIFYFLYVKSSQFFTFL